jgi:hypothetical protein
LKGQNWWECIGRSRPFPKSELIEPLFSTNTTLRHDHDVGLETDRALLLHKKSVHNFTLATHPNGQSSILIVSIPHSQACMIESQDESWPHHRDHSLNLLKALHDGCLDRPKNLYFLAKAQWLKIIGRTPHSLLQQLMHAQTGTRASERDAHIRYFELYTLSDPL